MKSSWVLAIVMLYLIIMGCEVLATGGSLFSTALTTSQSTFIKPDITSGGSSFTGEWALLRYVGSYLAAFISIAFLYAPTVFSGYLIWVWQFICLPVSVMFWFSVVGIFRGVHSG